MAKVTQEAYAEWCGETERRLYTGATVLDHIRARLLWAAGLYAKVVVSGTLEDLAMFDVYALSGEGSSHGGVERAESERRRLQSIRGLLHRTESGD